MSQASLVACHECDLLQRQVGLAAGGLATCDRCGAILFRDHSKTFNRALAFSIAGLIVFVIANSFPIVGLEVKGELVQTTLFGAVQALYADQPFVAALVLITTIVMPLVVLGALAALLLPLHLGYAPSHTGALFRALRAAEPWCMVEVFMLGVLVALVKLAHIATVVPGIAAWSFGALVVLLAVATSAFDPNRLWARAGSLQ